MRVGVCNGVLKSIREHLAINNQWQPANNTLAGYSRASCRNTNRSGACIERLPGCQSAWEKLSYSHKREYTEHILNAKKEVTRQMHIIKPWKSSLPIKNPEVTVQEYNHHNPVARSQSFES
jgi:hypothetical protein